MSDGDAVGSIATGALLACEIERARIDAPAVGHDVHEPCANCGAIRSGPYCHECGQAGHVHRNLGALVHDLAHGVFHFEGKIWTTLPMLAWRPGELTRRYVLGERAKFVSPMALFLFSVFLMFAVASGLAGHGTTIVGGTNKPGDIHAARVTTAEKLADSEARRGAATDPDKQAALDERIADEKVRLSVLTRLEQAGLDKSGAGVTIPGDNKLNLNTGWHWLDETANHAAANPELLAYKMKSYAYKYSWALIPISLPFIWLLFAFRRDVGLYDHAIFAIYSLAFMSLGVVALAVAGAIGLPSGLIVVASMIVPPVHMYRQLKGAYGLGRFGALWRTAALVIVTGIAALLFLAFVFYLGAD